MEEEKSKPIQISKKTLDVIRTTGRNNVQLVNIADNKANILMSLNAIMLTILLPMVLTHLDTIISEHLYLPLIFLTITSIVTIVICALVLRPADISKNSDESMNYGISPFFFGNYHKMDARSFLPFVNESLSDEHSLSEYILQDHYYVGKVLGTKYVMIRLAFQIFLIGLTMTILSTFIVVFIF